MKGHQSVQIAELVTKAIFAAVCVFCAILANAQDANELRQKLQHTSDKGEQITLLNRLGDLARNANATAEAVDYHQKALKLCRETGNAESEAKTLNYIGSTYWRSNSFDSAQHYYEMALEACTRSGNQDDKIRILNNLALVSQSQGDYFSANYYYQKVAAGWQAAGNLAEYASTVNKIGSMYLSRNLFDSALTQYGKALQIRAELNDTIAIAQTYNNIATAYKNQNLFDSALVNLQKSIALLTATGDQNGLAEGYNNLGGLFWQNKNYKDALANYLLALDIRERLGNNEKSAATMSNIGLIYKDLSNYDKALEYYNKSLEQYRASGNQFLQSEALNLIGGVYWQSGSYAEARNVYKTVLQMRVAVGDKRYIARSHNNLALAYKSLNERDSALAEYNSALELYRELGDQMNEAAMVNNIGNLYLKFGETEMAANEFVKALEMRRQIGHETGIAYSELDLGTVYISKKLYNKALPLLNDALRIARKIKNSELEKDVLLALSNTYAASGNLAKAYTNMKHYTALKDSILSLESIKRIADMQISYETEKKERELKIKDIQILQQQERNSRQRIIIYFAAIGLLIVLAFAVVVTRQNKKIRKANEMLDLQNKQIIQQNEEIEQQRDYVTMQRDQIAEQKEKITDSIEYASRIQNAMLTPADVCGQLLPQHFILLVPRDIVSGDFYWVKKIGNQVVATVMDCTGHGVPGAFMSMLGTTLLEQIVTNGFSSAADILEQMRKSVKNSLHQEDKQSSQSDGMDCALCVIDFENKRLQYSGANNPLIVVRNGEIIEYEADKMPIGIHVFDETDFTNTEVSLEPNDTIYMFSDGFADQFGGDNGRKLMMKNFKKVLAEASLNPIDAQKDFLYQRFTEWKGNYRQIDDVSVMGIRF